MYARIRWKPRPLSILSQPEPPAGARLAYYYYSAYSQIRAPQIAALSKYTADFLHLRMR